jgi:hypothetical protein
MFWCWNETSISVENKILSEAVYKNNDNKRGAPLCTWPLVPLFPMSLNFNTFDDKIVQLFVLLFACKDGVKLFPRWYVIIEKLTWLLTMWSRGLIPTYDAGSSSYG